VQRLVFRLGGLDQMPGDGFALTVRVGREVDLARALHAGLEVLDDLRFVARNEVLRREVMLHIHAQRALGEIANVPHRGFHRIPGAQVTANGSGLGR
jgi:hypothetical protein